MRTNKKILSIHKLVLVLFIIISIFSCNDNINNTEPIYCDCNNLKNGIIIIDPQAVKTEINKLTIDLKPSKTTNDRWGQKENIELLINRLNTYCNGFSAELLCYACMYTYPPQSAILLITDSLGTTVKRVIDIWTPDSNILSFSKIHSYSN